MSSRITFAEWSRAARAHEPVAEKRYLGNSDVRRMLRDLNVEATDDNMLALGKRLADRHGLEVRLATSAGLRTFLPAQAGRKPASRNANRKRYSVNRPTENAAIGRISGEARRRAEREERLAAAEAREAQS